MSCFYQIFIRFLRHSCLLRFYGLTDYLLYSKFQLLKNTGIIFAVVYFELLPLKLYIFYYLKAIG